MKKVGLILLFCLNFTRAFQVPRSLSPKFRVHSPLRMTEPTEDDLSYLKKELTSYLEKRNAVNADERARNEVGKVVGGTKGNLVLEYVSGSPNKEVVIEEAPEVFDYDELTQYGFGYLVTPIMNAGGRSRMYTLMNMPIPPPKKNIKKKKVPKLVIDRDGTSDSARYTGLKMMQIADDEEMGRQLAEAQKKKKAGESLRPKLIEEDYVQPFSDKRNTGPRQIPDWTPEMLDEEGRKAGKAQAWARAARAGEFAKDRFEFMNIEGTLQVYSILTSLFTAFSFGRATPQLLETVQMETPSSVLDVMQTISLTIILSSVGSSILCGALLAPGKNRSPVTWGVKGYAGGILAVLQLKGLDDLRTRGEIETTDYDQ